MAGWPGMYVGTAIIRMYAKCGSMPEARRMFDSIQKPDVVCWNALLSGYAENGEGQTALAMLSRIKSYQCKPDPATYTAALKACTSLALSGETEEGLLRGRQLHSEIGPHRNRYVENTLIDMYGKCGSMKEARSVFDALQNPDAICWNALLLWYAENGEGRSFGVSCYVLDLCDAMQDSGLQPDSTTLMCVLRCCSHAGFVSKSREYFEAIPSRYAVVLEVMHYTCMVDVLGCANQLDQAIQMIHRIGRCCHLDDASGCLLQMEEWGMASLNSSKWNRFRN